MYKIANLRWWICGLLVLATGLNYFDRLGLPVAISELQKEIRITDQSYGRLQFLFLLAYGLMYIGGGRLIDRLGTRWGYALLVFWWSVASALQGTARTVLGLGAYRLALGLGEGGGFPGSAKAVSEWFPTKERSIAFGLFNAGASVGAVLAPPVIAFVILVAGWRSAFFLTGILGLLWTATWLWSYRVPAHHPRVTDDELQLVTDNGPRLESKPISWSSVVRQRQLWGLMMARFLCDAVWYFFIFWLPKYLGDVRHLNIKQIGQFAWIPYGFAGLGACFGGWLSSYLMRRRISLDWSRKIPLAIGAAAMPCSLLIASAPLALVLAFSSAAFFGHQLFSTMTQTAVIDLFPPAASGTATGMVGGAGSFGAMIFSIITGEVVTHYHSFRPMFFLGGILHPISFVIIILVVKKIERLCLAGESENSRSDRDFVGTASMSQIRGR